MTIWLPIGLLLLAIGFLLVNRLLLIRRQAKLAKGGQDVRVYKDQLQELARDEERGVISGAEAAAARLEIQRRLLAAADRADLAAGNLRARPQLAGLLVVAVSGGSLGLYAMLGSPELPDMPYALRKAVEKEVLAEGPEKMPDLEQALASLAAKLEENPDNLDGWLLLGRTKMRMQAYGEAAQAFEKAQELGETHPQFLTDYATSLVHVDQGKVSEKARAMFQAATDKDPRIPRARYFLALDAAQNGKFEAAIREWKNMLAMAGPNDPWIDMVTQNIEQAGRVGKIDPDSVQPSSEFQGAYAKRQRLAPALSAETMKDAAQMSGDEQSEMIKSMVERLANRLKDNPDDLQGWLRLGNAYRVLQRPLDSADAYENAVRLDSQDTEIAGLYERALWEAGQAARQEGDSAKARKYLETLLARLGNDSPEYDAVKQNLDSLP